MKEIINNASIISYLESIITIAGSLKELAERDFRFSVGDWRAIKRIDSDLDTILMYLDEDLTIPPVLQPGDIEYTG